MAISSIGVGSGLPLEQLLADLRKSENQTLALIQSRQITVQSRLSAYGTIKSSIEALKTASNALGKAETFGALKTTVSGDGFTATASTKAIAGQYKIQIETLASAQTIVKREGTEKRDVAIGVGGVITVKLEDGSSKTLDLTGKGTSLDGLVKAINADSSLGISATIINDGDPNKPHRLLLTAADTGTNAAVTEISVQDNDELNTFLGFTAADLGVDGGEVIEEGAEGDTGEPTALSKYIGQSATDAVILINGIRVTGQTNTLQNAIEGVTLTLTKQTTEASALSVTRDDAVTSKAVNAFVTAYNALQNQIKSLSAYDVENQRSSALTGDSLARRVQSQVRDALNVVGDSGAIRSLSQMGITTDITNGTLKVDNDKLAAALKGNMVHVQNLFGGDNGLSERMTAVADTFISGDGLIPSATAGIDRSIGDLAKQYEAAAARIDAKMEAYRMQFTKLDGLVAQMNGVSSYLTQQLSMLGNMNDKK